MMQLLRYNSCQQLFQGSFACMPEAPRLILSSVNHDQSAPSNSRERSIFLAAEMPAFDLDFWSRNDESTPPVHVRAMYVTQHLIGNKECAST